MLWLLCLLECALTFGLCSHVRGMLIEAFSPNITSHCGRPLCVNVPYISCPDWFTQVDKKIIEGLYASSKALSHILFCNLA